MAGSGSESEGSIVCTFSASPPLSGGESSERAALIQASLGSSPSIGEGIDFHTLSRPELQVLCKLNGIRANMTNAAMAEALKRVDLVNGISYEMVPVPTVTTRLAARRSVSRKEEVVVSKLARLRRSQRTVTPKVLDQELKGEGDSTEVKGRAASKMPQAKLTCETSEDDDLDEDEEWALNDDDSAEEIGSTDESEVDGETHEENDTVFTGGMLQQFYDKVDTEPSQALVNELLQDLQHISLNKLRAKYNELKDRNHLSTA